MTAHALLGASSADRWLNCPGSIRLSEGIPDVVTPYAREGTAAHALAERCLRKGLDPDVYLGTEIEGVDVDEEMVEAVRVYVREVRAAVTSGSILHIETKFDLAPLHPPARMFGTADAVVYDPRARVLHVLDFKYGQGHAVSATGNPQLRYYALGAVVALRQRPERIRTTIVQPRAAHPDGIVRSDEFGWAELVAFRARLIEGATRTLDPEAPLNAGPWCRFCRALPVCPAQRQMAVEVAQREFDDIPKRGLPAPSTLTDEQLGVVLAAMEPMEAWFRSVRDFVRAKLERGESFPGWKLVPKRAVRRWTDPTAVLEWLTTNTDLTAEEMHKPPEIKSPAQIEALLRKANVQLPDELVTKAPSGFTLAPVADARPAAKALTATEEFAANGTEG